MTHVVYRPGQGMVSEPHAVPRARPGPAQHLPCRARQGADRRLSGYSGRCRGSSFKPPRAALCLGRSRTRQGRTSLAPIALIPPFTLCSITVHADTDNARGIEVAFVYDDTMFEVPLPREEWVCLPYRDATQLHWRDRADELQVALSRAADLGCVRPPLAQQQRWPVRVVRVSRHRRRDAELLSPPALQVHGPETPVLLHARELKLLWNLMWPPTGTPAGSLYWLRSPLGFTLCPASRLQLGVQLGTPSVKLLQSLAADLFADRRRTRLNGRVMIR